MIGRGIHHGDIVVVDQTVIPGDGDIVVALIDNESTLKTLVKSGDTYYLKPENIGYPVFIPLVELTVQGVVRTLIRNLC